MCIILVFFFNDPATTEIYTLSLHDALPICAAGAQRGRAGDPRFLLRARLHPHRLADPYPRESMRVKRSEEHTSELQSQSNLVCRLLLEKKKRQRQKEVASSDKDDSRDSIDW